MFQFERMYIKAIGTIDGFARHYFLLYSVVLGVEPDLVFEFGAGFSSRVIIDAMEDNHRGRLISLDRHPQKETIGKISDREELRLSYLEGLFLDRKWAIDSGLDIVLHDGSHKIQEVREELSFLIPKMKQNGILMVHDTYHPILKCSTLNMTVLLGLPGNLEYMTLPYGYGLTIARVREDFGHGKISPTWSKR